MAILVTGGAGKTSSRVARLLKESKIPFLVASRRGQDAAPEGINAVKFDWLDASTYKTPFEYKFPEGEAITAVYLVAPETADPAPSMSAFVDYAIKEQGVKKFVLLGGSSAIEGGPHVGKVWSHLSQLSGIKFAVLNPTWFMENFSEGGQSYTIKSQGKFYTCAGDGKTTFISADDIARVAYHTLTNDKLLENNAYPILGTELLSHDEVAATLSKHLGREIVHVKLTPEQRRQGLLDAGVPEQIAGFLVYIESAVEKGGLFPLDTDENLEKLTGQSPLSLDAWVQQNKAVWG